MYKVMVVDDMDIVRREIKRFKFWGEKIDFEICCEASNGYEALQCLEKSRADIVLTDIKMPKIDGLELTRKISGKGYDDLVILMSDYDDFSLVRQGLVLGAFDYLLKPIDEIELEKVLERAHIQIEKKTREKERINKMEHEILERINQYIPKCEVDLIVDIICSGSSHIRNDIEHIEGRIRNFAGYDNDLRRMEGTLHSILIDIERGIRDRYPWFDKIYDPPMNTELYEYDNADMIREAFIVTIEHYSSVISSMMCGTKENGLVGQVTNCVLDNIDKGVTLKFVADKLFMNKTYISEAFKQKTGVPFVGYLTIVKMERSMHLLREGKLKVYEVGDAMGFKDVEYFSRLFKKYTGFSPTEYQQRFQLHV